MSKNNYTITPIPFDKPAKDKGPFPQPLRALIVGSSGSGKTTLVWNIITKDWLNFTNLYIFTKSIDQEVYQKLQEIYSLCEIELGKKIAFFFSNCEEIISVDECKSNSLIIFDDCILEEQSKIKEFFVRGRHKNISCIYLSQCYSMVDLRVIRNNLNFICIFKQNTHYMERIFKDFVGSDIQYNDFSKICKQCWHEDYGFLTIDLSKKLNNGRYKNKLACIRLTFDV